MSARAEVRTRSRMLRVPDVSLGGAYGYWLRNAIVFKRTWILGLMAWFAEPVIYLVGMGLGLGRYLERIEGIEYIQFIAPGLLALSAMYGATFEVSWNAFDKMERSRVYNAATATPVSLEDVALGEIMWATTRATIYGSAFAVVATPFGVFQSWWGLLAIPALTLVGACFAVIGLTYTYLVTRIEHMAYYWTMFLTPMFMFSGIYFPLTRLPEWLQTVAWFMPLYHGTNLMRALMVDGDPLAALGAAAWLAIATLGLIWIPMNILRRRLIH